MICRAKNYRLVASLSYNIYSQVQFGNLKTHTENSLFGKSIYGSDYI